MELFINQIGKEQMFRFKQFSVEHQQSSMKVGTDAVLLGAWADCDLAGSILDIGTGCGVISLILAQRCSAQITGIDIHNESIREASQNFAKSPWAKQLIAIHTRLQDYNPPSKFNLIVSNPPFFRNCLKVQNPIRNKARHDDALSFEELLIGVDSLLAPKGVFSIILPMAEYQVFEKIASHFQLFPAKKVQVFSIPGKPCRRVLAELVRGGTSCAVTDLAIHEADGSFSHEYKQLTSAYYLNF